MEGETGPRTVTSTIRNIPIDLSVGKTWSTANNGCNAFWFPVWGSDFKLSKYSFCNMEEELFRTESNTKND